MSSKLQTASKRTQSTMNGSQAVHGKAERWGTWSHPKRARKQIPTFAQRTPSSSQREPASSALRRVFEPPSTAAAAAPVSSKPPPLRESQQQRQNKSASAPRPRTARAPIPHFRTYSHTQSSAAKSKAAVAPEPEDEDALAIARIHAWLDKVDDEQIAAEVEAERRAKARRVCEERPAEQPPKKAEAEAVQSASGVGEVEVDVKADVEAPKTPKAPKTPTRNRRLDLETDVPRVDSGWGTASPASIGMAFMTPRTIPRIEEDDAVWEMLSPNVTPFRKGRGPKRTRRRSYYDEDIWPSAYNSPQSLAQPVH
ncbi:hypothetical protein H109_05060 [Trichophyton interdigitale MR816]|uniref:Uncharacterized protein n=1 Tax=Trichophyton interdigitale (strain MR816) TaxID=1215338 RepID=A0A059J5F4_TRIIM|nr:hypothetical protein H109_05060 [Trichophyton interdigitale MR816]